VRRKKLIRDNPDLRDKYYTSEEAIYPMLPKFIEVFGEGATILDCCAGQDTALARILRETGFTLIENDLDNGGKDFLEMEIPVY
jgi:hypothetical protein